MIRRGAVFTKPISIFLFHLLVIVLITLLGFFTSALNRFQTYGVNKTIGWAYDFCTFILPSVVVSFLITLIGYGVLSLFKLMLNKVLSIIQLLCVTGTIVCLFIPVYEPFCFFIISACVVSILLFVTNLVYSLYKK